MVGHSDGKPSFIISVNGKTSSSIEVMQISRDMASVVECAHSLVPPENGLLGAVGGVFTTAHEGGLIVVCGGEVEDSDHTTNAKSPACAILSPNMKHVVHVALSLARIDASSLMVDNGNRMWVIGGTSPFTDTITGTEYVIAPPYSYGGNFTHKQGISLHEVSESQCLTRVGPQVAHLSGGHAQITPFEVDGTIIWFYFLLIFLIESTIESRFFYFHHFLLATFRLPVVLICEASPRRLALRWLFRLLIKACFRLGTILKFVACRKRKCPNKMSKG